MPDLHDAHGYWLAEAGPVEPAAPLEGERSADVVVIGGGYTGLWTAWHLKRLEPEADVAVCEAGICGEGPSGRNGGFVNALWFSLPAMRRRFGDDAARSVAVAAQDSVDRVAAFCENQRVDAWFRQAGYMQVSTAAEWDGAWMPAVEACRELGLGDACRPLSAEEVEARCASPVFREGVFYPGAATVHPARLVRGLRDRVMAAGVTVYERTAARLVEGQGGGAVAQSDHGRINASAVVLATGAQLIGLPRMRRRLTLTSSHMVITEPVPDLLEQIGWTGGECVTDSRAMIHYFRTTPDGRIAFGWGGGRIAFGSRAGGRAEVDRSIAAEVERHLRRFFPGLRGRRVEHAWGGPIDVSPSHLPVIDQLEPRVHCAYGYTGHGVGPSQMVGRALASLALDRRDEASRLAIISPPPVRVPPEPFRYVGGTIIRAAILRRERLAEQERRADPLTRVVAGIPERLGIHIGRG
jgi:glycine/D-amino acid oxidase-like deaminating enzyme